MLTSLQPDQNCRFSDLAIFFCSTNKFRNKSAIKGKQNTDVNKNTQITHLAKITMNINNIKEKKYIKFFFF